MKQILLSKPFALLCLSATILGFTACDDDKEEVPRYMAEKLNLNPISGKAIRCKTTNFVFNSEGKPVDSIEVRVDTSYCYRKGEEFFFPYELVKAITNTEGTCTFTSQFYYSFNLDATEYMKNVPFIAEDLKGRYRTDTVYVDCTKDLSTDSESLKECSATVKFTLTEK